MNQPDSTTVPKPEATFESFVEKERERLTKERDRAQERAQKAEEDIKRIDNELRAIKAYEDVKQGKLTLPTARGSTGRPRGRRGEKREAVLQAVRENPGITRAGLLEMMHAKDDKSATTSITNALAALNKAGLVSLDNRQYTASP